ncbi:hypothetical protein OROMI_027741 [Orobanche minor]
MASSQTTFFTEKKKEAIIDGRLFVKSVVMNRIQKEHDDSAAMALVVSRIKQTGLFNLGRQHSELYDESLVEEFYQEASVYFRSENKVGGVAEIFASICGVEIRINRQLLEDLFSLPSFGLKLEELESFGSEDLLSSFWCVFIGDSADKKVHPLRHKKRFILPFVYLHDFCCRIVENRTGAFEMCTNLHFRMMVAIMFGEPVNWCQVILKRLQEEVSKPMSQKKSIGLLLTNIFSCLDVPFAINSKKIDPGKFIGGSKPTAFNKDVIPADRPLIVEFPQSESLRDVAKKSKAVSSKKRKHSLSDTEPQPSAPEKKKKKLRKAHKPKPTGRNPCRRGSHRNKRLPLKRNRKNQFIQKEDSVPLVPSSIEPQVSEASTPHDESLQQPATEPSVDAPEDRLIYLTPRAALLMLTGPEEPVIRQESPRSALRTERLEALGHQTVFIQDAVNALHKVGKALDKLILSAAEEIGGVTFDLYNLANALQVLPQLIKVALSNIQQQRKEILEKSKQNILLLPLALQ